MATSFPTSLDDFINYVDGTTIFEALTLNDMQFAIEALQAKVGINNSVVTSSHDYKLANLPSFGARTFNDTEANPLVKTSIYKSQVDGFLTVSRLGTTGNEYTIKIEQGDATPDVTVALIEMNSNVNNGITIPIRKDDFVTLTQTLGSGAITYMSFVPIGTGGLVKQ